MKVNSNLAIELAVCFIVFILMFAILGVVSTVHTDVSPSTIDYTLIDTFEDDTNGTDPNGNDSNGSPYTVFYSYQETTWNVTDDVSNATDHQYDGNNGAWYKGNNSGADASFTFYGEDGNQFCGRTDISEMTWALNFESDNYTNEGTDYTLYDCDSSVIVWLNIQEIGTKTCARLFTNGPTELMNITLLNMTFYRVVVTIDYSGGGTPSVSSAFYGQDLPGLFTVLKDSNTTSIDCSKIRLMVVDPSRAGLYSDTTFDDLEIDFSVNTDITTGIEGLPVMWAVIVGIFVLCIIIGILFLVITEMQHKKKGR